MYRSLILTIGLVCFVAVTASCNLNAAPETAPPTVTVSTLPVVTVSPSPGALLPTVTQAATSAGCTPRADWTVTYTVAAGDTLGGIASRAASTVNELAQGNCLADANTISVGLVLRVPRPLVAVPPPTITTSPPLSQNPPPQQGSIYLSSYISADAGQYGLLRGDTITVRWDGAPSDAARVSFWLFPYGWTLDRSGTSEPPVGEDFSPADGAAITWSVPGSVGHQLVAFAYRADNALQAYSFPVAVSSAPVYGQGCEVAPAGTALIAYTQPDASSAVFGTLQPGSYGEVLGRSLNGWYAFEPGMAQAGNTGVARLRWLPVDSNLVGRGNCAADIPQSGATRPYTNSEIGLTLDIPASWIQVDGPGYVDFRAPDNASSVEINLGVAGSNRPIAEEAAACIPASLYIGNRLILSEKTVTLPSSMVGYQLELSADRNKPDTQPAFYVFFLVNGRNILLRGFSNSSEFFAPILNTLRPA